MVKAMELQERRSELLFRHLQTASSLCMGISNEIELVTIAIYEATTLEIKAAIALLFQSSLTMLVCLKAKQYAQKCASCIKLFRVFV